MLEAHMDTASELGMSQDPFFQHGREIGCMDAGAVTPKAVWLP